MKIGQSNTGLVHHIYSMTAAHSTCDGTAHRLLCNSDKFGVNLCPTVSAVHLKQQIQSGDKLLLVLATLGLTPISVHAAITRVWMAWCY